MRENHMLGASMKNWNNQKQQIPTLEILPEGTKLAGVTAVIPVFFIAFGIMEMLQNIWGDAAPGHLVLLIGLAFGMLCCCAAEVLKQKKKRSDGIQIISFAVVWLLAGIPQSIRGLQGFWRITAERWSAARDGGTAAYMAIAGIREIWAVTLVVSVLVIEVLWMLLLKRKHRTLGSLICAAGILIPLLLDVFHPVSAAFLSAGMIGLGLGSKSHAQWKSNCAGLLACLLVFLLPAILLPQERIPFFTQLLGDTKQKIYEIRYGKDGLPEGNLYEADTLHAGEEPVLAIRSEQKKNLYFKGYVGGTYANGVWEPLSGESYRGTSSGMLEWLAKKNFDPLTQMAQYYALGDEEDKPEANRVYVENTGASRYYIYAPASLKKITTSGAASEKKDQFLDAKGLFGKQNYGMTEVSSSRPAELVVAGSWVENPETEEQKTYSEAESVYRTFVYDHYTAVDQTMYDKMQEVFWEEDPSETDGIYSALGRIRKVLESRVTYSENPGAIPGDEDPVFWFLDESKEGNAMLYASTAVEALRAKGIPARYVEGYFLSESAPTGEKGQAELTGNDAHAWVEIYFDGIGWLPADVTPGYYYNVASLQKMVGSPDSVQKNVVLENNSLSAEQITGVENRKSKAGEAVLPVLRSVSLFLLGLLGVLLILLTLLVIAAEAARIICLGPAAKKQQKERPGRRIRRTEARIYQYLYLWGIDAGLGWETAATDAELARRFPAVEPGEYTRVCHLIEKHIYGEILLSPYEERTLNHFLEKLMEPVPGCSWKMRLKLRYACLRRVNTKKKKRKHSAFQQK